MANIGADLAAVIEAGKRGATIFKYLEVGQCFRFLPEYTGEHVKIGARKYRAPLGEEYRTSPRAAVYPVQKT